MMRTLYNAFYDAIDRFFDVYLDHNPIVAVLVLIMLMAILITMEVVS